MKVTAQYAAWPVGEHTLPTISRYAGSAGTCSDSAPFKQTNK